MTKDYIEAIQQTAIYQRKAGTANSYYWTSGTKILPERLSISREEIRKTGKKGRSLQHIAIGLVLGNFKKNETSPLKLYSPFHLRTYIWQMESFPLFIGYGVIGISNNQGKIDREYAIGDLIVLQTTYSDWKEIKIHYFAGSVMELVMVMESLLQNGNVKQSASKLFNLINQPSEN